MASSDRGDQSRAPEGQRTRVTMKLRDSVVGAYTSGLSAAEVAESTGIAKSTVLRILRASDVAIRPRGRRLT